MTSVFCSLGVALLLPATVLGGRNTQSTDTEYKYGGADVTGEHLGAMPHNTGVDMTKPNQAYCDGCLVAVEEFHMQWLRYVTKESQEVRGVWFERQGEACLSPAYYPACMRPAAHGDVCGRATKWTRKEAAISPPRSRTTTRSRTRW